MANPYTTVSISGYNNSPPPDDGTQSAANEVTWAKHKTKLGDPLKTAIESIDSNVDSAMDDLFLNAVNSQSTNYTVLTSDRGALIDVTALATITLPAASTAGSGFVVAVYNSSSNAVTIDGSGSETINGGTTRGVDPGKTMVLMTDGSEWRAFIGLDMGLTATSAELNTLDGITSTVTELNKADADTSGGGFLIGPTSSSDPSLAFDTWRTPNANRPTQVQVEAQAETDGIGFGTISYAVDESGGTSADYGMKFVTADPGLGNGGIVTSTTSFLVPAGGSYRIVNVNDPNTANLIEDHREFTL